MTAEPMPDLIERLAATALDCREAITQAHVAMKDLKAAAAEAREAERSLRAAAREAADEQIAEVVAPLVRDVTKQVGDKQQEAIERVFKAFDDLAAPLKAAFAEMGIALKRRPPVILRPEHGVTPSKVALPPGFTSSPVSRRSEPGRAS